MNNKTKITSKTSTIITKAFLFLSILMIVFGVGFFGNKYLLNKKTPLKREAVFMNNGQVYFGYISNSQNQMIKLEDVYYLKIDDLQSADPNKKIMIVKMGNELHRPENTMYINRDQILFYQPITNESKINDAILKFAQKQIETKMDNELPK